MASKTMQDTMDRRGIVSFLEITFGSLFLGPTLNGIFGFGEELGWRGYLLPKLMPLGKPKAYLIVGVIWGLWHAPIVAVGLLTPVAAKTGWILWSIVLF